jgi:predicted small lipoprotein YifL
MKALAIIAFVALLLTGLAGCGQKGPLYLPEDEPATVSSGE